jgi:hypothetical protein
MLTTLLLTALVALAPRARVDSVDACGLFTRDEVKALAGEEARKPQPSVHEMIGSYACRTTSSTSQWTVAIEVQRLGTKEALARNLDALRMAPKSKDAPGLKPVSGLGDQAYWGQIDPHNGMYHVVVGTTIVNIQTWGKGAGAGTMEKTRPIADLVVQRYKERYGK